MPELVMYEVTLGAEICSSSAMLFFLSAHLGTVPELDREMEVGKRTGTANVIMWLSSLEMWGRPDRREDDQGDLLLTSDCARERGTHQPLKVEMCPQWKGSDITTSSSVMESGSWLS
jgi:hypothetical protein